MEVLIDRAWKKDGYTISRLYVNGNLFGCNTLEDTDRGLNQKMDLNEIKNKKKLTLGKNTLWLKLLSLTGEM